METQHILKIQRALFPEDRFKEFETLEQPDGEFQYLRSIRKIIIDAWKKHPDRKDFLLRGIDAFEEMRNKNLANTWNILINKAYLYEYLDNKKNSDECLIEAVKHAQRENDQTVFEKADRFFQHFTRKASYDINHEEWYDLLKRQELIVSKFSKGSNLMVSICKKFGNKSSELTAQIIQNPQEVLECIEIDLKQLFKLNQKQGRAFRINLRYLDQILGSSLESAKSQLSNKKLSKKCDLLLLILYEVMISTTGVDEPRSFRNYVKIVKKLYNGEGNLLEELKNIRTFNLKEEYIEKAIALGELKRSTTKPTSEHANRFHKSLSDMYLIRGYLKLEKKGSEENSIDDFVKAANLLGEFGEHTHFMVQIQIKYGDDADELTSQIIKNSEETLQKLEEDLKKLLKLIKNEESSFNVYLEYLDQKIGLSLKSAKQQFVDSELSTKCDMLLLILNKIMISTRSEDDPNNFINYAKFVEALDIGRKNGLDTIDGLEKFYDKKEYYLEKAIELGEQKRDLINLTDQNAGTIYCLLASMYRIRGHSKREKREKEADSLSDFCRAVELFRKIGDALYDERYFDRNVERFAECLSMSGEYESAILEYKKLFNQSDNKKFHGALGLGKTHCVIRNFEESEYWYLQAEIIDRDSPAAYDGLVQVNKNQGEYAEAVKLRTKMLELPDITDESRNFLHFDIGELYLEEGTTQSLENAIDVFKDIIRNREPDSHIAFDRLIKTFIELEKYDQAINWLQKKIKLEYTDVKTHAFYICRIGDCYSWMTDKPTEKEKEAYQEALIICPDYVPALQRIASWHERKGEYAKTLEIIEYLISNVIDEEATDGLWKWKGDLNRKKEDWIEAFKAYEKCININYYRTDAQYEINRLFRYPSVKKYHRIIIDELIEKLENQASSEIAHQLVNMCLLRKRKKYAKIAEKYLKKCGFKPQSAEFILKKASILEVQEKNKSLIRQRQKLQPLGNVSIPSEQIRLNNLKSLIQTINENKLYKNKDWRFKKLRSQSFNWMVGLLKTKVDLDENITPREKFTEEIKNNIYRYREEIYFVSDIYHSQIGQYSLALRWIKKLTHSNETPLYKDKVYLFKEAEILLSLGRTDKALNVLDQILKYENYQDALALFLKGRIKRDYKKDFPEAIKHLNKAYEINKSESIEHLPSVLDQLGLTYRKWAKYSDLSPDRKQELKEKAVESYQKIIDGDFQDQFDRRAYHGLAQSYLIGKSSEEEIRNACGYYYEILRIGLNNKGSIQKKDLDQIAVFELLDLWEKEGDETLKKILNGESPLLLNLEEHDKNFIKWRITQAAKRANIFEKDVFDTIKAVFQSSSNESLRQHCSQYFMKYLIYKSYNVSEQELQDSISDILDIIISVSQEKKYIVENLAWFLAGERGAYLDLITQELKEDLDEISSTIFKLTKDNLGSNLDRIRSRLDAAKYKLKNIGLTKVEPKNISKEIHSRSEDLYKDRIGNRIKLETNIFGLDGKIVSKKDWITKEDMILDCFDLMNDTGLYGTCTLYVNGENESNNDLIPIKLRAIFNGSHEEVSEFDRNLKQKFAPKTSFKINKRIQDSVGNPSPVFEIDLWLKKIIISDKNPFEELSDFNSKNFFHDENQVIRLIEQINNKISSIDSTEVLKGKLTTYLYHQMVQLTDQAKNHLAVILDKPHKLKYWSERPTEELWSTIEEIQINFQSLKLMKKQFYFSGEDISFSLSDIIDQRIKTHSSPNIPITFQREENSNYQIVGDKLSFEIMINNLCFNSVKSVKTKQKKEDKYKPEITVHLSTNNKEGEYELRFRDNGVGLDPSTTIEDQELGFGLRAVSYFLHNCDGEITIEEACKGNNSGVTFLITLPIREEE